MNHDNLAAARRLVSELSGTIDRVLRPLLPAGAPCALLDFPDHANVGDSAIWLGETDWLRRADCPVVYTCDMAAYSPETLAARLGGGVILLSGGGNLGDFWWDNQQFRERVIQDFPRNKIIQLPQTIHFEDEWAVGEARRVFNGHPDLTLLCRDQRSLDFARAKFARPSLLCPDMAFALGPLADPGPPVCDVLWLCRTDGESAGAPLPNVGGDVERADWLEEAPTPLRERSRDLVAQVASNPAGSEGLLDELTAAYGHLARERLDRGWRLLGGGKIVITDRLHGHILCLMMGMPHVLLDNVYGKLRRYYDTWTHGCALARWADSPAEALALAAAMARTGGARATCPISTLPGPF
jgi:exopolysaccharide biosynthesis predicted pyruvyltransferase EpsI